MEIGGRNAKSPVPMAGVPSPSSRFLSPYTFPVLRLQHRLLSLRNADLAKLCWKETVVSLGLVTTIIYKIHL